MGSNLKIAPLISIVCEYTAFEFNSWASTLKSSEVFFTSVDMHTNKLGHCKKYTLDLLVSEL